MPRAQAWVSRQLNMSTELVKLRRIPLVHVLDFTLRHGGPFAYADHSAPIFVCGKPLDLEESERQLAHLQKRPNTKVNCIVKQCNKRVHDGEELYEHLLEHPEFCSLSDEQRDETLSGVCFQ